jgi:hypothetical protein
VKKIVYEPKIIPPKRRGSVGKGSVGCRTVQHGTMPNLSAATPTQNTKYAPDSLPYGKFSTDFDEAWDNMVGKPVLKKKKNAQNTTLKVKV